MITSFVAGVGATTLPLHIYSMLKVGVTPEVNAVSTLLLAATIVPIVLAQLALLGEEDRCHEESRLAPCCCSPLAALLASCRKGPDKATAARARPAQRLHLDQLPAER